MTDKKDDSNFEIPEFLSKHGITKVTDNIPEGHHLKAPAHLFSTIFSDELIAACTKKATEPNHVPPD